ncbi:SDR family oxidoreductase [Variovorax sp. NFACC27]|uniref:SDR family NAD(P)-dependent oxidoreductase n=1 Tax=unclassified Variovorax TaxID=663243 RepID=UPI00089CE5E0|nr:3-oxoacyl-[acyl-carrier protein] reductase [Variovorax sp. NFACC28]SEG35051.1 3-oxoacyl-[acyl-carrier protein] reductase [Variovorax sp. NFACC29]SFD94690.1 3-oxoacyl-[acyl-carrier protein] reductase [Variovorax sp. NFACC26]SFH05681.1 3-oxoacyl-[acyl-carrier protein] reductase [Variovorax sp. NFACC27]
MDLGLEGARALVTASTGGIGREIARALAREGAIVHVNGRTAQAVDAALVDLRESAPGARLEGLVANNGDARGCGETIALLPEIDILVNNLGIYEAVPFTQTTDAQWLESFEVNVMSGVRLGRHYIQGMLQRGRGRIVFLSSEAAIVPAPELPHYSASKSMLLSVSRTLAELTRGSAVTVNAVVPGSTRTEGVRAFVQELFPELPYEEAERRFVAENRGTSIIARLIDPLEVADLVAFVCSRRASAINGAALRVDGGIVRSIY